MQVCFLSVFRRFLLLLSSAKGRVLKLSGGVFSCLFSNGALSLFCYWCHVFALCFLFSCAVCGVVIFGVFLFAVFSSAACSFRNLCGVLLRTSFFAVLIACLQAFYLLFFKRCRRALFGAGAFLSLRCRDGCVRGGGLWVAVFNMLAFYNKEKEDSST